MTWPDPSSATVSWMLNRLTDASYEGGYNGTCYECPFASPPLIYGRAATWAEVGNDPTEAVFKCSLPGRDGKVEWGEYAPCTAEEWTSAIVESVPKAVLHVIIRPKESQ
jgi:hypothetical protein